MCVEWKGDWEVATEDLIAYKFVERDGECYRSPLKVEDRASQDGRPVGAVLTYRIGEQTVSDEPGIYCAATPITVDDKKQTTLAVKIPKGAKYRRGKAEMKDVRGNPVHLSTINALCVEPVRERKETYYPQYWYSTSCSTTTAMVIPSTSSVTMWSYVHSV